MSQQSENLFTRAQKVSPGGVHSPVRAFKGMRRAPIFFQSASGAYLQSVEGKRYIDFCQSFGPLVLGHRDPDVQEGVQEMIHTAWTFGACEPYSLELAEWITSRLPWVESLRFVSSGTEAVMSALRLARAATGRDKILKFEGCYHGHVDSLLVKAGSGLAGASASSSAGVSSAVAAETLIAPLDEEILLEEIFQREGKNIAALILEPLPANNGLLLQRKEFLQKAFALAKANGSLIIFDEVISGFRVALGGMAELLGVKPDLVTYGKVIGGGFPVGCYGGCKDLMEQIAPLGAVYQAGTLSANPVGMRAGLLTLQKMEKENGWSQLEQKGQQLESLVKAPMEQAGFCFVRKGSIFWFHEKTKQPVRKVSDISPQHAEKFFPIFTHALEHGVYLAPSAYEVGFLSLAHSKEDISTLCKVLLEGMHG